MDLVKRLKNRGHKLTPQRETVFAVLSENAGRPMSPEEIYRSCAEKNPGIGLTTVYRTLELFRKIGVALSVHLHEGSQYYELNTGKHHHHLVCMGCGTVEQVETCIVDEMNDMIRDDYDFLVTSHCLSLFGYCPVCLAKSG
jgi:Fur family ferric uptake transcriptional regulator